MFQPVSQPAVVVHSDGLMPPPLRLFDGPRSDE